MRSYVATFTHPTLAVADLTQFLGREFSLDALDVQQSHGTPSRFRVTFRHPWLDPATMESFLARTYAPDELRVEISGEGGIAQGPAAPDSAPQPPRPRGKRVSRPGRRSLPFTLGHRLHVRRDPAITELLSRGTVVSKAELRAAAPQLGEARLNDLLGSLLQAGEIRRVEGRGRYIAADRPDPAPEEAHAGRPRRKGRARSAKGQALEGAILAALAQASLVTRSQLQTAADATADAGFYVTLKRLVAAGQVRDLGQGVYQVADQVPADASEVESFLTLVRSSRPTPQQGRLLTVLPLEGEVALGPVAQGLGITRANAELLAKGLVACGLVHLSGHRQGRRVALSEAGRAWTVAHPQPDVIRIADAGESVLSQPALAPVPDPAALLPEPPQTVAPSAPVPEAAPVREVPSAPRRTGTLRAGRGSAKRKTDPIGAAEPSAAEPARLAEPSPSEPAAAAGPTGRKSQPSAPSFTEDLLAYLDVPRTISEITNRLGQSHAAVVGRLEELEHAGRLHKTRKAMRFLYCVDPERLA